MKISHLEFETLLNEMQLKMTLTNQQIELFDSYKNSLNKLLNKKESMALEFAIDFISKNSKN